MRNLKMRMAYAMPMEASVRDAECVVGGSETAYVFVFVC